jgi:pilus assembly protein Flp/PilA
MGALEGRIQEVVRRTSGGAEAGREDRTGGNNGRRSMKSVVIQFIRDEQGQDLVEYALIVAAVGLALITTVNQLSAGIVSLYQSITGDLASIGTPAA